MEKRIEMDNEEGIFYLNIIDDNCLNGKRSFFIKSSTCLTFLDLKKFLNTKFNTKYNEKNRFYRKILRLDNKWDCGYYQDFYKIQEHFPTFQACNFVIYID